MANVTRQIKHYQLEIARSTNNPKRIFHCLKCLDKLDVTFHHLETTGVGKTVNALRPKYNASINVAATSLINKWKVMVALQNGVCVEYSNNFTVQTPVILAREGPPPQVPPVEDEYKSDEEVEPVTSSNIRDDSIENAEEEENQQPDDHAQPSGSGA